MKLAVVSHKVCWGPADAIFKTDGGFPVQVKAISELFDETVVVVPCERSPEPTGITPLTGQNLSVRPLSVPKGTGMQRKVGFAFWLLENGLIIWREIGRADAVHAPIPGDVGTIGMLIALVRRKPLFVRHCGNWAVRRTCAEFFWKWAMERFAGGRNVMMATGGNDSPPSQENANIKWIFSTSLTQREMAAAAVTRELPACGPLRLAIACRQEEGKGTDVVIESLAKVIERFPSVTLDVVGDGAFLPELKKRANTLGLQQHIVFHGRVEQKRVVELMKHAHIFCYPTSSSEGFPKVVLEALASGLPVITTKVSVLPDLIRRGCGILLEAPTSEELAAAIGTVASDPVLYRRMSECATTVAYDYTLEKWRDQIGEALRRSWQVASLTSAT
ncbi:MAG: glycosyltransferase [Pyrinomonadaceae bacterium]